MKRYLGRLISRTSRRLGYDFVKLTHTSLGAQASVEALAAHLKDLFAATNITCVLDAGANQGQYYEFLRDWVGFGGRVISFEPVPALAGELALRSAADPLWTVCSFALGSRDETLPLRIAGNSGWTSFLEKAKPQVTEVADAVTVTDIVTVPVHRLDCILARILPEYAHENIYLKLDTQGFDLEVLQGAGSMLAHIAALQTELEFLPIYANAPSYISVLEYLQENQYALTGAFPVWRDRSLRVGEMDAVFRNVASGKDLGVRLGGNSLHPSTGELQ